MKFINFLVVIVLLMVTSGRGAASESLPDSLPTEVNVQEMIRFLEDEPKVAEFTRQLRELDSMRIVFDEKEMDKTETIAPVKPKFGRTLSSIPSSVRAEMHFLHSGAANWSIPSLKPNSGSFTNSVMNTGIGIGAVFFILYALLTIGGLLKKVYKKGTGKPRIAGILSLIFTSGAVSFSLFTGVFIISKISGASLLSPVIAATASLLLSYFVALTLIEVLFTPDDASLRMLPCGNAEAKSLHRGMSRLAQIILLAGLLTTLLRAMHLPVIARLLTEAVLVVLTIHVPFLVYSFVTMRKKSVGVIDGTGSGDTSSAGVILTLLRWIHVPVFIIMAAITVITLWADDRTFQMILHAYVRSVMVMFVGGFHLLLWNRFLAKRFPSQRGMTNDKPNPAIHLFHENRRIIATVGYLLILTIIASVFVKTWNIHLFAILMHGNPVFNKVVRILLIVSGAWICIQIAFFAVSQFRRTALDRIQHSPKDTSEIEKRISTLSGIFQKIVVVSVLVVGVIMVLDELGYDVKAMIAGIGIVGIAVGFGAQNLVRDIISGLFIIFENRIRVGDVAIINGTGGKVEQVNLRTIVLRSEDGTIHVFPNGAITTLSNMTHEFSYYVFSIGVDYREDTDKVEKALEAIGSEIAGDSAFSNKILEPLEVMGVDRFADSSVIIKARIKTVPLEQWNVGREMNKRIKKRFDELKIEFPYPHHKVIIEKDGFH